MQHITILHSIEMTTARRKSDYELTKGIPIPSAHGRAMGAGCEEIVRIITALHCISSWYDS